LKSATILIQTVQTQLSNTPNLYQINSQIDFIFHKYYFFWYPMKVGIHFFLILIATLKKSEVVNILNSLGL